MKKPGNLLLAALRGGGWGGGGGGRVVIISSMFDLTFDRRTPTFPGARVLKI